MLAVREKSADPSILLKAPSLLNAVEDHLETSLELRDRVQLAQWAASLPKESIKFHTIKGRVGNTKAGESVVVPDWDEANRLLRAIFGPEAGHRP